ncbi:MAG: tetratricopeptide repeat protein [Nitrospinae bacterium]|nr:tetratricopeptide repeat protein [Nitrospinota bacterium]
MQNGTPAVWALVLVFLLTASPARAESSAGLMNQGIQSSLKGDDEKAVAIFKEILSAEPANFYAHNNLGMVYAKLGKTDLALESYKAALKINPKFSMTLNNISRIYKQRGEYGEAETYLKKAIQEFPSMEIAHANLGEIYLIQKRYDEAIEALGKALELKPDQPQFRLMLAKAYEGKGLDAAAQKEMELYDQLKKKP